MVLFGPFYFPYAFFNSGTSGRYGSAGKRAEEEGQQKKTAGRNFSVSCPQLLEVYQRGWTT